uniref:RING-type E3 ubiquitin transferase n=1 Tax=Nothoprocta perdicaria TaxID=30464 RepID=A0A8C6ZJ69_NOTPE
PASKAGPQQLKTPEHSSFSPGASMSQVPGAMEPSTYGEEMCPICLDTARPPACPPACLHQFCLGCIQQWAATKAERPLCRRPFDTTLCQVPGEDTVEEHHVEGRQQGSGAPSLEEGGQRGCC